MTITPAIRELIDSGPLAHMTTLNSDGSPQVSVVWVANDGNEFLTAHMGEWQKVKNLRKDPRVALSLLGRGKNAMGLQEYLVVYGQARITEGGAAELPQRLARIYLGPNVDTNLKATFVCAQEAARRMVAAGRPGAIINTSRPARPTAALRGPRPTWPASSLAHHSANISCKR